MNKTKVVEVIPNLGNGGAEKLVFDLCSNFDKDKIDLTLVLFYDDFESKYYKKLAENRIQIITLGKKAGLSLKTFFKLNKHFKKINPNVVHTHLGVNLYLLPYYIFHKKQIGYHTIHNIADKEQSGIHKKISNWLFHHRNVKPIAISAMVKETILKTYNLDKKNVPLINNGVDLSNYIEIKNTIQINNFIAVGRFMPQKNYPLMLNAFKKVLQIYPEKTLIILGDGEQFDDMLKLSKSLNIDKNVFFKGNVNNVLEYLQKSDCFLMSSDFEGLPLSMVEAMACGLPVVATMAGGIVDLVEEGKNGYLSEIGDVDAFAQNIIKMIENKNVAYFSQTSKEKSKNYSLEKCVQNYEELLLTK